MSSKSIIKHFTGRRIGVLMGGRSGEREVSLRSGANVLAALQRAGLDAAGIDAGTELAAELRKKKIAAAFIVLHGRYGEDGTVQGLLEMMDVPYTGSGVLASALAMHKAYAKQVFREQRIPTPDSVWMRRDEPPAIDQAAEYLGLPLVVKPPEEGSSLGVSIARDLAGLRKDVAAVARKYGEVLVERFVPGMNITVGILGSGAKARALPILELVPKNEFYDYQAKYTQGLTEFVIPARLPGAIYKQAQQAALCAHRALGCRGWSRVDIIVDRAGTPLVLEVNTCPGMTDLSDLPAEAKADGIGYDDLVLEILDSARR
ncbi:MAG TPA: D-alanine--D-alanine ligase [Candidatus Edwardsbacteria bacterium]|nr:D-alanine--D-alanine ligase [Candidatus Edwardsbacteria bacterium]